MPSNQNSTVVLLERARTQWQFGDWRSLARIPMKALKQQEGTELAGYLANAHLQLGNQVLARQCIDQLLNDSQAAPGTAVRMLVSSLHNTLGRASLAAGRPHQADAHFIQAIATGQPSSDVNLLGPARGIHQAAQLDMVAEGGGSIRPVAPERSQRVATSNMTLLGRLYGKLYELIDRLDTEGRHMVLDGMPVFNGQDPFMAGKVALGMTHLVTEFPAGSPTTWQRCQQFKRIEALLHDEKPKTWGIFFYLIALTRLDRAGVLDACFGAQRLVQLKEQLHWKGFVDSKTYLLKNRPNNFYQVAFAIAQMRFQLGWESNDASTEMLDRMVEHYEACSGEYGFADETEGEGRYDRYSILLIAEIAHRFREADLPLPGRLKKWLRNSAELVLINLNEEGNGFQYGRSIGAYGDSAFIEILSAAAWHNVLSSTERQMAYTFCCLCTEKFLSFWWDDQRGSVNLWEDGRQTDAYRAKTRIIGENISLLHQHLYTHRIWSSLGYTESAINREDYTTWLNELPTTTLTWFSKHSVPSQSGYALLTYRDADRVFNLPLINGAEYAGQSSYLPIPYASGLIQGVPDSSTPILLPTIIYKGRPLLLPVSFHDITCNVGENSSWLQWSSYWEVPKRDAQAVSITRVKGHIVVTFRPGNIEYSVSFMPEGGEAIPQAKMVIPTYAQPVQSIEERDVKSLLYEFRSSDVCYRLEGFVEADWVPRGDFKTSSGAVSGAIVAISEERLKGPETLKWQLYYK